MWVGVRAPGEVRAPCRHRGVGRGAGRPQLTPGTRVPPPGGLDVVEEALPSGLPPTFLRFTHHSYAQMVRVLKQTAARCTHIAKTYSIGRSFDGRELLVIEFSSLPGQHELSKPLSPSGAGVRSLGQEKALACLALGCTSQTRDPDQSPRGLGDRARAGASGCAWGTGVQVPSHRACVTAVTATSLGGAAGGRSRSWRSGLYKSGGVR